MTLAQDLPARRLRQLERRLGYTFADRALLREALLHSSYLNEHDAADGGELRSNERLEFLGDSILGSVVARTLFDRFPDASEGRLTEMRSLLVRNQTLGEAAARIELGQFLAMGTGIERDGARKRGSVLGRALEAVLGAVWLDGGHGPARELILRLLADELAAVSAARPQRDAKSRLQEATQKRWGSTPTYALIEAKGPPHDRSFRVSVEAGHGIAGEGGGRSKRAAEQAAAGVALQRLEALLVHPPPGGEAAPPCD